MDQKLPALRILSARAFRTHGKCNTWVERAHNFKERR
jgi:hypothetical protein